MLRNDAASRGGLYRLETMMSLYLLVYILTIICSSKLCELMLLLNEVVSKCYYAYHFKN